jgi:dTDP-4-dehydrorhamnose reductase
MNVLVLGGAGIVGTYLVETAPPDTCVFLGYRTRAPRLAGELMRRIDCSNETSIRHALDRVLPDVVVNAVGQNSIDECQKDPPLAFEANVRSTLALVRALRGRSTRLLHLSTNAVYSGLQAPYAEASPRNPVSTYGETKRVAEDIVLRRGAGQHIVRLSPLYGWSRNWSRLNALPWIVSTLRSGSKLNLCNDIWDTPLSAMWAAQALWHVIASEPSGPLNLGGAERVSRYEFGLAVADAFALDKTLISGVPSTFFANLGPRPVDSSFCVDRQRLAIPMAALALKEGLGGMREHECLPGIDLLPGRLHRTGVAA